MMHGEGKLTSAISVYEGDFKYNLPDGYGKLTTREGEVYEGDWVSGLKHGMMKFTNVRGIVYQGRWEKGEMRKEWA